MNKAEIDALATNAVLMKLKQKGPNTSHASDLYCERYRKKTLKNIMDHLPAKEAKALAKLDEKTPRLQERR